jgi:hypothetical protein
MQMFWMDTDPAFEITPAAKTCASSKYSIEELKLIFMNEVRPAVQFNLYAGPVPEWTGFELEWLTQRILKKHRFGKSLPLRLLNPYSYGWWYKLENAITKERSKLHEAQRPSAFGALPQ